MATITADHIASVSLKDADRDPEGFAAEARPQLRGIWLRDHRRPRHSRRADPPRRGEGEGLLRAARGGEAQISDRRAAAARAATRRSASRPPRARQAHDLKEFWHVGRDLPAGHQFRDHMPDNLWPAEVPSFKDTFQELFATFDRTGLKVLKAIARYLKIDEDYFEDTVRDGNSVLRALHYPPQSEPTGEHIRAGAHEDINTITLLLGAEEAGLELLDQRRPLDPGVAQARRAGGQHRRHAAAADQRACCARPPTASSTRRPTARATRATRCPSSSTSARIS